MKLVKDWRRVLAKSWAVRSLMLAGMVLPQVWVSMPDEQRAAILDLVGLRGAATIVSFIAAIIVAARLLHQNNLDTEKK